MTDVRVPLWLMEDIVRIHDSLVRLRREQAVSCDHSICRCLCGYKEVDTSG